jgi:hypothetical protein
VSDPYMKRFHQSYPGMSDLYHTYCEDHTDFGICGTLEEAEVAINEHKKKEHKV